MSVRKPFLRGRVSVKRVASVCGMIAVLPLMGCGSSTSLFDDGPPRREASLARASAGGKPSRPVLASAGSSYAYAAADRTRPKTVAVETTGSIKSSEVVQSYASVPTSATGVQRTALAPLPEPAKPQGAPSGYALNSVDYRGPAAGQAGAGASGYVREAANYGPRKQRSPYAGAESDYREADEARRGDYAPEPGYESGEGHGGGLYIVQPGDTLYGISQRHGVSIDELIAINGLSTSDVYVGQQLRVEGGAPGQGGKGYRQGAPEPRGYRPPAEERPAPYRGRAEARGEYAGVPSANVYERRSEPPRYDGPQRYEEQSAERGYGEKRPPRRQEQAYEDPRGFTDRPEYTSSNRGFTPDGPFPPSPDAPWRGEAEWRRLKPQADQPDAFEVQPEPQPRYEGRRTAPAPAYEPRPAYKQARPAYEEPRPPYQAQPVERAPYGGRPVREPYAGPPRGGEAGGGQVYTVQRGDTLYEIARRTGIDQRELADFNGLPHDARLIAGQDLRIPSGRGGPEWQRPRPEANSQPAPVRARPVAQTERIEREARPAPTPVAAPAAPPSAVPAVAHEPVRPQPRRIVRAPEEAPPRPAPEQPAAPEVVEEEAPPAKAAAPHHEPPSARAAVATAGENANEAVMNDAGPAAAPAQAQASANGGGARECETLLASPEPRTAKTFRMPVQGMVIAKFGAQEDGSFNDGINFSVPKGTPVKAAENGVVAYAGDELPGFGNLVLIRHADGYVTAYAHNDELLVKKCDVVKRGQIISKAGASGKASAPQLHFEVRKDSKPIDPDGHFSGT